MTCARRGQAAVEAALSMPLTLFLALGLFQLSLALQARVLAEYAAARAVRVGSTNHADCRRMMDATVLALLPSFASFARPGSDPTQTLADTFRRHGFAARYRYDDAYTTGGEAQRFVGEIAWLEREFSRPVSPDGEREFDQPAAPQRLSVRLVYFFPLKVPFANWVISKMVLGYSGASMLMGPRTQSFDGTRLAGLAGAVRARDAAGEKVLPIVAEAGLRMMSPVRDDSARCGAAP